jgi:hypothetical protein
MDVEPVETSFFFRSVGGNFLFTIASVERVRCKFFFHYFSCTYVVICAV